MTQKEQSEFKQLAVREQGDLVSFSENQVSLIKNSIASKLDWPEFALFMAVSKKRGLDPLLGQIHAVKRRDKNSPTGFKVVHQVGIDGYRTIGSRSGDYAGSDKPVFVMEGKRPIEASITVYKIVQNIRVPFVGVAYWDEFYPGEKQGHLWRKMPKTMIAKCAEAQALRKGWPDHLAGLYIPEEMQNTDSNIIKSKVQEVEEVLEMEENVIETEVVKQEGTPECCGKPMMVSKYPHQDYEVNPWYCVECKERKKRDA